MNRPDAPDAKDDRPPAAGAIVLLVDDQPIIGEAVRRMVSGEEGFSLHYCREPAGAIAMADEVAPTVILLDLVMPDIDGLELLRRIRALERFRDVPILVLSTKEDPAVKAEAFAAGANDYLVKLPDRVELAARIRHHSRGYTALLERNAAFEELRASREVLAADIATAARYVRSLLPVPGLVGEARADWRFIPSASLGGDAFGYHALDEDRVALYLLDVCGHGVGAALLSVSVLNAIRAEVLAGTDFRRPAGVLAALNKAFPMERHDEMYFTIWYGVYDRGARVLRWAGGGHPPALLFTPGSATPRALGSEGPIVGAIDGMEFAEEETAVPAGARLFLFSDGAFEIVAADGGMWCFEGLRDFLGGLETAGHGGARGAPGTAADLDAVVAHARSLTGPRGFIDDISIVGVEFP